jgi:hypothetical protein
MHARTCVISVVACCRVVSSPTLVCRLPWGCPYCKTHVNFAHIMAATNQAIYEQAGECCVS